MSVYKRSGSTRWQIEFEHAGKTYRRSSGTQDKRLAEKVEAGWKASLIRQADLGEVKPMTVLQATDRYWVDSIGPSMATNLASSHKSAASRLKAICVEFGPHSQIATITGPRIAEWKSKMLGKGKAPATVDRSLDLLRSMLQKAKNEWGTLATVPVIGRLKLGEHNARDRFLSDDEEASLLKACAEVDADLWDLVATALDTGGRRGELLQVRPHEVYVSENLLGLLHTKSDLPRSVPMTVRVRAIAVRRLKMGGANVYGYDPVKLTKDGCREGSRGAPTKDDETGFRAAWKTARAKCGIKNLKFHDLRHTFASRLAMRGVSLQVIGELLGHKDPKTTKRYAHLQPKIRADAIALLEPTSTAQTLPQPPGHAQAVSQCAEESRGRSDPAGTASTPSISRGLPEGSEPSCGPG